jgi:CheY-like chemotaxis protein
VVDDNATNRAVVGAVLKSWGCRLGHAADGDSALATLRKAARLAHPFEVALLDMEMPGLDGKELGRHIAADPQLTRTALLLMASPNRGPKNAAPEEHGFAGGIKKPVMESPLRNALSVALGKKKAMTEPDAGNCLKPLASARAGARILVAEDIASNRDVALAILTKLGYHTDLVTNGAEALAAVRSSLYDLVLMDCEMPEMDGYEATRRIRKQETLVGNVRLPIIALTAHAISGDQAKCMESGMDDYLCKPIEPRQLAEALAKWLPAPRAPGKTPAPGKTECEAPPSSTRR